MKHLLRRAALVVAVPALVTTGFLLPRPDDIRGARLLEDVMSRVQEQGLDSMPAGRLYQKAARGMVRELDDPYAQLFSPEEVAEFARESIGDAYGGLGMEISQEGDWVVVVRVFPGTPAERGGILAGDRIVEIDGQSAAGLSTEQVTRRTLGRPGTEVEVALARGGLDEPIRGRFTRAVVQVPAVPYALMLAPEVGYLPLQRFSATARDELERNLRALTAAGAERLVLDLRGNSGGHLNQAIAVAGLFLPRGSEVVSVRSRAEPDEWYAADDPSPLLEQPLVVLVDENTASASEIVAGALQDHDRALVVGQTSFGKGLVQDLIPLREGWVLKLTTSRWYTPSGRSIQREDRDLGSRARLAARAAGAAEATDAGAGGADEAPRPAYRSEAGRIVFGGGGITPDLVVDDDTLSTGEQRLARLLAPSAARLHTEVLGLALELQEQGVARGFAVRDEWRERLYARLSEAATPLDRAAWEAGAPLVDRLLARRLAGLAFGESAAFLRGIDEDLPLQRALALLGGPTSTAELLGLQPAGLVGVAR